MEAIEISFLFMPHSCFWSCLSRSVSTSSLKCACPQYLWSPFKRLITNSTWVSRGEFIRGIIYRSMGRCGNIVRNGERRSAGLQSSLPSYCPVPQQVRGSLLLGSGNRDCPCAQGCSERALIIYGGQTRNLQGAAGNKHLSVVLLLASQS